MDKLKIGDGELSGGLNSLKQHYTINYMPKTPELCDKIEIAINLTGDDKEYAYRSLRFSSPDQLYIFLNKLIKSWAYFMKNRGQLNENNFEYWLDKFYKESKENVIMVMKIEPIRT